MKDSKKRIFISHPFSGDEEKNKNKVDKICKNIMEENNNILPISPLHLWGFMKDDNGFRKEILSFCFDMIFLSDEIWVYNYGDLSSGQQKELEFARSLIGVKIKIIDMR